MFRKIFCFGLGLIGILHEKFDDLACAGEERLAHNNGEKREQEIVPVDITERSPALDPVPATLESNNADDLTTINGIGPTFAKRLTEAGVATFNDLADLTAEQLKEITHAADWQANPEEWILQAKAVA